jgi:uncharacterized coiled-coil DUF342 family protein
MNKANDLKGELIEELLEQIQSSRNNITSLKGRITRLEQELIEERQKMDKLIERLNRLKGCVIQPVLNN